MKRVPSTSGAKKKALLADPVRRDNSLRATLSGEAQPEPVRPFSQVARVRCRGYSLGLQRALTDFGAEESFAKASQRVREHYGIEVGAAGVRHQTLRHAEAMAFELETEVQLPKGGVAQLLAETDGSMIPVAESKGGRGDKGDQEKPGVGKQVCLLIILAYDGRDRETAS